MPDPAFNLAQVLWDERMALEGEPLPSAAPAGSINRRIPAPFAKDFSQLDGSDVPAINRILNSDARWALCLSGGGIRSAAFALGIIQCLADHRVVSKRQVEGQPETEPILQQFEYLSTVSGGGYIGSWLSAWLYQARLLAQTGQAERVLAQLNQRAADRTEVEPIGNLRRNSHYLAPKFSALSPDIWTDIAAVVRNLVLNWLLFLPPMMLLVLLTKGFAFLYVDASVLSIGESASTFLSVVTVILILIALSFAVANRPARGIINLSQRGFLSFDLLPLVAGAILIVFVLISPEEQAALGNAANSISQFGSLSTGYIGYALGAGLGVILYAASWFLSFAWDLVPRDTQPFRPARQRWQTWLDFGSWCFAGAVFGVLVALGLVLLDWAIAANRELGLLAGMVAAPGFLLARMTADVIYIVPAERIPGADANLEYQSRSGGIFALVQLAWIAWFGLVLFGSYLAGKFSKEIATSLAATGGLSGLITLLIASSSKTAAVVEEIKSFRRYLTLNQLAAAMAAIFGAVLLISFSMVLDGLLSLWFPATPYHASWSSFWFVALGLLAVSLGGCFLINVNRYSLHGLYRNRLVRGFLGASRRESDRNFSKNRFTDFDSADSPFLYQLWQAGRVPTGADWQPLHIINVALNLVSSKNLAWQERMAAPFTFSPLHAGSASTAFAAGAFRPSYPLGGRPYGGRYGVTLGTAMAISGAAVSPNMGYNTSPGLSFLMTLFNVRLGWWLGNPKRWHYWHAGPSIALRPFVMEMFGLTSEKEAWVYLSDGGHFENLGVYEMVRRRSRVVVVSDAGCDPNYLFDDLGNALRKIWIDLGIRIDFVGLDRLKKRLENRPTPAREAPYWAVGRIRYRDADGAGTDGWLLYIKAGLHGTECMDVLSYATTHLNFPHESTVNQFFTESQFESYRALGFEIAYKMLCYAERARRWQAAATDPERQQIMAQPIDDFRVTTSAERLDEMIEHLRDNLVGTG